MPRKKKCPGCGEDQALHKPGTANKHCEGLPTPGLPPSAKKGEETTQGSNLEALQQRKLDLQRALEAKKLQAEIDELEKQLAGDAPAVFGDKKKTAEETALVDKRNTGEESNPGDEKKTGEESTPGDDKKTGEESTSVDRKNSPPESTLEKDLSNLRLGAVSGSSPTALLGKDDVTLDQLRQNTALQRAVEAKFDALTAPAKSAKDASSQLQRLDLQVAQAKRSAFAPGTYRNLQTQWRAFLLFCEHFDLTALPATSRTLVRYAQFLSRSLRSVQTIRIYLHGVKQLHLFHDLTPPDTTFDLKLVLMSLDRHSTHVPVQKLPITPAVLLRLHPLLDLSRPLHATLWAVFTIAFFTLLRKSNLVPKTPSTFDPAKHLTRDAITITDDGLVVRVTWSKTIQFRNKVLLLPVAAIPAHPLCPRRAYLHMCSVIHAPPTSPAFLVPRAGAGFVPLTHDSLVKHLKTLLEHAGLPAAQYSGHSFRRGGATFAWRCGADPQLIKFLGDWASDAFEVYLDSSFTQRKEFGRLLSQKIRAGLLDVS
ncbi:uncharacterized protein LOC144916787 [Branchiostoma floridae x Branchiostoma belcheri]